MKRVRQIIKQLFLEFDTVTIRLGMACASLIFAGALWASPAPFTRDAYSIMEWVGPQWLWAAAHIIYGVGTILLIATAPTKHRPKLAFFFNAWGFFIWSFYTLSVNVAVGYLAPGTALELIMSILLGWSLIRTDYGRKVRYG